jgi:hypothetical protein
MNPFRTILDSFSIDGAVSSISRLARRIGLPYDGAGMPMSRRARRQLLKVNQSAVEADWQDDQYEAELIKAIPAHFAGFTSLGGSLTGGFNWLAQNALTGASYTPTQNTSGIAKRLSVGTSVANNVSGGADEAFSFQQGLTSGSSATLNLQGMTDLLQRSATSIVRMKGYMFRLLSAADDATISPAPTSTSTVLITNIGVALPAPLDFQNGGSGLTGSLTAAGPVTAVAIGAAGSGYPASTVFLVVPQQAGGSGCAFAAITNSSGVPTSVVFITGAGGSGYATATVPTTPAGQYLLATGGFHMYGDPVAAGFCALSGTAQAVKLVNMDASHAVTVEVNVFGGTT